MVSERCRLHTLEGEAAVEEGAAVGADVAAPFGGMRLKDQVDFNDLGLQGLNVRGRKPWRKQ